MSVHACDCEDIIQFGETKRDRHRVHGVCQGVLSGFIWKLYPKQKNNNKLIKKKTDMSWALN